MPSAGSPEPVAGRGAGLSLARGQKALAFEVTRRLSRLRDGDGPRPCGKCPLTALPALSLATHHATEARGQISRPARKCYIAHSASRTPATHVLRPRLAAGCSDPPGAAKGKK